MAGQTLPESSGLDNLIKMLSNFSDKTTTETTKSTVSSEQTSQIIKSLLSQTQGLAAVAGGQRSAGLYNSTVNQQLINDLLSQVTAKVAQTTAGTTRTTKTAAPVNVKQAGGLVASLQAANTVKNLLGPVASKVGAKYGMKDMDDVTNKVMGALGLIDTSGISAETTGNFSGLGSAGFEAGSAPGLSSAGLSFDIGSLGDFGGASGSSVDSLLNFASTIQTPDFSFDSGAGTDVVGTFESIGSNPDFTPEGDYSNFSTGSDVSAASSSTPSADSGADISWIKAAKYIDDEKARSDIIDFSDGDWTDDVGDISDAVSVVYPPAALVRPGLRFVDAEIENTTDLLSDPGQWFDDLLHGENPIVNNAYNNIKGIVTSIEQTGDLVGRATETTVNAVNDVIESVADALGSVICTELHRQGKLSKALYVYGKIPFASYREAHKAGYYVWAIPTVRHLRKYPKSMYSKFIAKLFNARAKYLATTQGCTRYQKTLSGYLADRVLYYGCVGLSYLVPKSVQQDWKVLYGHQS